MSSTDGAEGVAAAAGPSPGTEAGAFSPKPPAARKGFLTRHRAAILLAALVLYTVALAVAVGDEIFHLGFFPTDMERQARTIIEEFDDPDPGVRSAAVERLFQQIEGFVAVPELIRALGSPSPQRRAVANDCLKRLTHADLGFDPNAAPAEREAAIAAWRAWWDDPANQRRF